MRKSRGIHADLHSVGMGFTLGDSIKDHRIADMTSEASEMGFLNVSRSVRYWITSKSGRLCLKQCFEKQQNASGL